MQDTVYAGAVAGTLGGLAKLAVNLILYLLGAAKTTTLHMAAAALLPKGTALNIPSSLTVGLAVDWLVAVLLGIIGVCVIRVTGRDFLWLKGAVYGGLIWVIGCGYLAVPVVPPWLLRPDLATSVSMLVTHLAFGLIVLFVAGRCKSEAV